MPTDKSELLEYFKKHADEVIDSTPNVQIEKGNTTDFAKN
jgi:hypothetical protein